MKPNELDVFSGNRISLIKPSIEHMKIFVGKAYASKSLHALWTKPPLSKEEYLDYLERICKENQEGFLVISNDTNNIIVVININDVVRGHFQSGYLGYYCFAGYEGKGLMSEGLQLVISYAFNVLKLHRLEANIQSGNLKSISFIERNQFHKEGYSPNYLRINNIWEDHNRYALTSEMWQSKKKKIIL